MISIPEITSLFSEYEPLVARCPICGKQPMFWYSDSCTAFSKISLGHTCGPKTGGAIIEKAINLVQLSQCALPEYTIRMLLEDMVNEWNRRIK